MRTKEELKQFILDTLLPYKEDPSLCAYYDTACMYEAPNGNRCALGKHIVSTDPEVLEFKGGSEMLFACYKPEKILSKQALSFNIDIRGWEVIQHYHDTIGEDGYTKRLNSLVDIMESHFGVNLDNLRP